MRNKTNSFFPTSLVSRGNGTHAILNVMQRICIGDFTDFLETEYDFKTIKAQLIVDGVCQLPSQYDEKLLKLIQRNDEDFQAQYQQEPISSGGNLFKEDWFDWTYKMPSVESYESIFFTVDTAYSSKEEADYTCAMAFGVLKKRLYLFDMLLIKIDSIEIPNMLDSFCGEKYSKYNLRETWIEPKASGVTIIQALRKFSNYVKLAKEKDLKEYMKRIINKRERANAVIGFIDAETKNVAINRNLPNFIEFKKQLLTFTGENKEKKDAVDCFVDGIKLSAEYYTHNKADYATALSVRRSMGM
jgi:phage terminase large subunit-like protein